MTGGAKNPLLGSSKNKQQCMITWWTDPDTGKTIVDIPFCKDPCRLLEIGEAICEAFFIDADGKIIDKPEIKIVNGQLLIPCDIVGFEVKTAVIEDVECPTHLVVTPCGKNPLPPIPLNPVQTVNGVGPDKNGDLVIPDCCHYHMIAATPINPSEPPVQPPSNPAGENKSEGDTITVCHPNGTCYYTCQAEGWVLDYCKVDSDCCHYQVTAQTIIDPSALPATPVTDPAAVEKSPGDTVHVCHPNGSCYYTCVDNAWVLDFCKIDKADCCHYQVEVPDEALNPGELPTAPPDSVVDVAGADKSDKDTLHVCYANGSCYFTCVDGAWVLDFCKVDPPEAPDCCHYHLLTPTPIDAGNPPAQPPTDPAGEDKSEGDTLHVCHSNGSCYYTCRDGDWVLDFCKVGNDCCHYQVSDPTPINSEELPTVPPNNPGGSQKSDGDTVHVCHPNGSCYYTCLNNVWVLDFCKLKNADCCHYHALDETPIDAEAPPATPTVDPAGAVKSDGDTYHVCHPNGSCYYTCSGVAWVLDFCKTQPTKEELLADVEQGICQAGQSVSLLTDACEFVEAKEILPVHSVTKCELPAETLVMGAVTAQDNKELTMTQIAFDGYGASFFNSNPDAPAFTNPNNIQPVPGNDWANLLPQFKIPMPAVSRPGCILALQISYGGLHFGNGLNVRNNLGSIFGPMNMPVIQGGNYENVTRGCQGTFGGGQQGVNTGALTPDPGHTDIYFFDPVDGQAGSNLCLDIPLIALLGTDDTFARGHIGWYWYEICPVEGDCSVADINFTGALVDDPPLHMDGEQDEPGQFTYTSEPYDTGDCPALIFSAARHVDSLDAPVPDVVMGETDWSSVSASGYMEANDASSISNEGCQFGYSAGLIPGGSGPWTYDVEYNTTSRPLTRDHFTCIFPTSCERVATDTQYASTTCPVEATNFSCLCDGRMKVTYKMSVRMVIPAGGFMTFTPRVNGALDTCQAIEFDNSSSNEPKVIAQAICCACTMDDIIAPEQSGTATVDWCATGTEGAAVMVSDLKTEGEIIHV